MRLTSAAFVLLIFFDACVEPFSIKIISAESHLTVDGLLSDAPGPYEVKLFYSSTLGKEQSILKAENGASVWIISDANESELLTFIGSGTYQTRSDGIRGRVGRSYKLKIITSSGKQYESDMETMQPAGSIDDLYFEFKRDGTDAPEGTKMDTRDVFNVFIDSKGTPNAPNLFRWRMSGIYSGRSAPELHTKFIGRSELPDPLPCSGYVVNAGGRLAKVAECTCCVCWATEYNSASLISNNIYVLDDTFVKVQMGKVPVSKMRFYDKYQVTIEQLSVSERVYNFWKLIQDQQKATGNLFQPNSVKVRGNVHSITSQDEEVLGIFSISAMVKKTIVIKSADIPYQLPPIDIQPDDCRNVLPNATNSKPVLW